MRLIEFDDACNEGRVFYVNPHHVSGVYETTPLDEHQGTIIQLTSETFFITTVEMRAVVDKITKGYF